MGVLLENWPAVRQKAVAGGHACGHAVGMFLQRTPMGHCSFVSQQLGFRVVLFCFVFLLVFFFPPKKTDIRWWGRVQFLLQNVFLLKSKQKQNEICFDRRGGGKILADCMLCDLTRGME